MKSQERAVFGAGELAVALSHYDIGVIESITNYPRGSRQSPKVGIVSEKGKFLLKRRTVDRASPDRVRFIHKVQEHLASIGFPVPKVISTCNDVGSVLQIRDHVYEMFEFVAGQAFRRSPDEAYDSGRTLARLHLATSPFAGKHHGWPIPKTDFHDSQSVRTGLSSIGSSLSSHDSFAGDDAGLATLVQNLLEQYDRATEDVNAGGWAALSLRMIHSDWHPGNLLFRNDKVVAVIDYDTLRMSRRVLDVANGALQFSMIAGGDPASWPDHLDEQRFHAFVRGYQSIEPLTDQERALLPGLMIEALISECVPPITETGSVGQWGGYRVLQMVRRKVAWMAAGTRALIPEAVS